MTTDSMSCERALAILAGGGERRRDERLRARLHASRCPRCSSLYGAAGQLGLPPVLDGGFAQAAAWLRVGLVVVAGVQLVLAGPWLLGHSVIPDPHVGVAHLTRDGALGFVIAIVGLLTAWRPRYVHSTLVVAVLVLVLQVVSGLTDHDATSASGSFEFIHVLVLVIFCAMFAVAADLRRRATPRRGPASHILRVR